MPFAIPPTTTPHRKLALLAALLPIAITIAVVAAEPAAAAPLRPTEVVSASIAPGSHIDPKHKGYFVLHARPGDVITQGVIVQNFGKRLVVANVENVDAMTADTTGVGFGVPGSEAHGTAKWISIPTPELQLEPRARRRVDFTVRVPRATPPGQYLAGISVSVPVANRPTPRQLNSNQAGFGITLQAQRAIAVEVDIAGPRRPALTVSGARPVPTPKGIRLRVAMSNTGNAYARGHGVVTVADTGLHYQFTINTFVPKTTIGFPVPWTKNVVVGNHPISVRLDYDDGRIASWDGIVAVTGAAKAKLERELRQVSGARAPSHSSRGLWLWLALVATACCIAVALVMHRESRRDEDALAPLAYGKPS